MHASAAAADAFAPSCRWSDPSKYERITDRTAIDTLGYINTLGSAAHLMIATVFGFTIFVVVFITAPISGGHINPAVTFGLALARRITLLRGTLYVVVQCFGAIVGSWLSMSIEKSTYDRVGGGVNGSHRFNSGPQVRARVLDIAACLRADASALFVTLLQITVEFIGTALLLFTVFAVVDPGRNQSVIHVGALGPFAIGMAVFVAHLALIPITGTSINPARSLGPAVAHGTWYKHWIFWLGPMTGAAFAAVVYELTLKGHTRAEAAIEPALERKPAAIETAAGAAPPPPFQREE
jgi:MIP family channel proteins